MPFLRRFLPSLLVVIAACGGSSVSSDNVPELPVTTAEEVAALLESSTQPVVLNVWASWCIPCRSEAPLLDRATEAFGEQVKFVGVNVRDSQGGARGFIAEFFPEAPIQHLFDRDGFIPTELGGNRGVPLTFFFAAGGELVEVHTGVIDERTLALQIDEIIARSAG